MLLPATMNQNSLTKPSPVTTKIGVIEWYSEDIVCLRLKNEVQLEHKDLLALIDTYVQFVATESHCLLLETGLFNGISKEARDINPFKSLKVQPRSTAVVVKSLPTRLMVNFFVRQNSPSFPVEYFKTTDEALSWLKDS